MGFRFSYCPRIVCMWPAIRRVLGLDRRRAFDAVGQGRRIAERRYPAGATVAARRAGYYARNNTWVSAAVQGLVAQAVGTGVKPRSMHPDAPVRNAQPHTAVRSPASPSGKMHVTSMA